LISSFYLKMHYWGMFNIKILSNACMHER